MISKKELGQFFTTNSDYILFGFEDVVKNKSVLDPFAGSGDLLNWAQKHGAEEISGIDIDTKLLTDNIVFGNSLQSIPYSEFNITNPPYLAKNKMTLKHKKDINMSEHEDLYLLSIRKIIDSGANEGILIIPVNFFSAENSDKLRVEFLSKYRVAKINYFKTQVFSDTTYNVVSFHYVKSIDKLIEQKIDIIFFPNKEEKIFVLEQKFNYRIAGNILDPILKTKPIKIIRITEDWLKNKEHGCRLNAFYTDKDSKKVKTYSILRDQFDLIKKNIILLNCIDTNASESGWIRAEDIRNLGQDCLVGKNTSRNLAHIILPDVSLVQQEQIIPLFNSILNELRRENHSLFLTNFRDNDRKRISFDFCYKLITSIVNDLNKQISPDKIHARFMMVLPTKNASISMNLLEQE